MNFTKQLEIFLKDNPPKDMPYWPGAQYTGRMGLRSSREVLDLGASPLHLGVDRAGGNDFLMPFDGVVAWKRLDASSPIGSLLVLSPYSLDMEIQVFHTDAPDRHTMEIEGAYRKGDKLPVKPGRLGLSTGIHTHTEVLFPWEPNFLKDLRQGARPFVIRGTVDTHYVKNHCDKYDLNEKKFLESLRNQVETWGILEASNRYAIREQLPVYRAPVWAGENPTTIHVDSRWFLQI